MSSDLSVCENYKKVCDTIDIQSFIDFTAFQTYIVNMDCMFINNNWSVWRSDVLNNSNNYADCKWRFLLYDTDDSTGLVNDDIYYDVNYFENMKSNSGGNNLGALFYKLIDNHDFRNDFYNRCSHIYSDCFDNVKIQSLIDEYVNNLENAVYDTNKRFGLFLDYNKEVDILREFYKKKISLCF